MQVLLLLLLLLPYIYRFYVSVDVVVVTIYSNWFHASVVRSGVSSEFRSLVVVVVGLDVVVVAWSISLEQVRN